MSRRGLCFGEPPEHWDTVRPAVNNYPTYSDVCKRCQRTYEQEAS